MGQRKRSDGGPSVGVKEDVRVLGRGGAGGEQ